MIEDPRGGIEALITTGLDRYAKGDLAGAIEAWERALRLDEQDVRARDYLAYVRENFSALEQQFDAARQVADDAAAAGVPVLESAHDPDAYELIDISSDGSGEDLDNQITMDLDSLPAPEPDDPTPAPRLTMRGLGDLPLREGQVPPTSPPAAAPSRRAQPSFGAEESSTREMRGEKDPEGRPKGEFDTEFSNAPSTHERRRPAVIVDEQLLAALSAASEVDLEHTHDFAAYGPTTPAPASGRARSRAAELLEQAEAAADGGDFAAAVEAIERAGAEDTGGVAAGLLLERRELVYRIYEGHIGDLSAVPLVAVPLHEIAAQHLNHRTGFLLSRIDGMLSFEDILDVAGMPRMEAYKILSGLLRRGVIEVR